MLSRRHFLIAAAAATACKSPSLSHKQRVDRALKGLDVDRPPFSFWYHFGLQNYPAERHAEATINFHRKFDTDVVKVMSDFAYPRPKGSWHELRELSNPFPEQIRALQIIREEVGETAHFIETAFNPWNLAEKLSSPAEVLRLKDEKPQALLDALEAITKSLRNHARQAVGAGASGIFLAIANADETVLSPEDYAKFSEPFDKMVLEAVPDAPINTLHLHGGKVYLDRFYQRWPATVHHYSTHATGIPIAEVRNHYSGVIMGGIDEVNYRKLSEAEIRMQWRKAQEAAGKRFILAPGCSVPNETADGELHQLRRLLG